MLLMTNQNTIDASTGINPRPGAIPMSCVTSDRNHSQVISISPVQWGQTGEDRLRGGAELIGIDGHAAVGMHAVPVTGAFWSFCPKTKTTHFQHSKVAP